LALLWQAANDNLRIDDEGDVPQVQLHEGGYLFMASSDEGETILRRNHQVQLDAGCDWMRLLDPSQLQARFPWINTEGIKLASLGEKNEGWFDPWALLSGMRAKATNLGVHYIAGEVSAVQVGERGEVSGIEYIPRGGADRLVLETPTLVNAAGAFAANLVSMCGPRAAPLPVKPRKRCIFVVHCPEPLDPLPPLTVDPSGVYIRPEGAGTAGGQSGRYICGVSPSEEDDPDCTGVDELVVTERDYALYEEVIWPTLYNRCEALGDLKVTAAWAGFYEYNTLDQNAIMGEHPDVPGLFLANGFSGHGLQQSPGVGRAIAELIVHQEYRSIDLNCFRFERFADNRLVPEANIV